MLIFTRKNKTNQTQTYILSLKMYTTSIALANIDFLHFKKLHHEMYRKVVLEKNIKSNLPN